MHTDQTHVPYSEEELERLCALGDELTRYFDRTPAWSGFTGNPCLQARDHGGTHECWYGGATS